MSDPFDGKTFVFAGFYIHRRRYYERLVVDRGARTVERVSGQVDYVVVSQSEARNAYSKAMALGIETLSENQLSKMLEGNATHHEPAALRTLEDLFGNIRAHIQEQPVDEELWYWLVKKLDRCVPEQLPQLVAYIEDHVGRWRRDQMHGQRGYVVFPKELKKDALSHKLGVHRQHAGVAEDLRVAPLRWFSDMAKGERASRFRLIRALDFKTSKLTASTVAKIVKLKELRQVSELVMSAQVAPTKGLVKALWDPDVLPYLDRLHLLKLAPSHVEMFAQESTPKTIGALDVHALDVGDFRETRTQAATLLGAPLFDTVERLSIPVTWDDSEVVEKLATGELLPALNTLELAPGQVAPSRSFSNLLGGALGERIETLCVRPIEMSTRYVGKSGQHAMHSDVWNEVCGTDLHPHIHTLDLSGMFWDETCEDVEVLASRFISPLFEGALTRHVKVIMFGRMLEEPAFIRQIERHAPEHVACHAWHVPEE